MNHFIIKALAATWIASICLIDVYAAPAPCKGPNKNDPECLSQEATPPTQPVIINSASVDWLNEKIMLNGQFTSPGTTFRLSNIEVTPLSLTATHAEIPFDSAIHAIPQGNHSLLADDASTTSTISLYLKGQIIDQALNGCPCTDAWSSELGSLWNPTSKTTACLEISSDDSGNSKDIAGLIYSDQNSPPDPAVYPQYAIGAAFTAEPNESVCRLSRIDNPGSPAIDLVNIRINRSQQEDCRTALDNNICDTINGQ